VFGIGNSGAAAKVLVVSCSLFSYKKVTTIRVSIRLSDESREVLYSPTFTARKLLYLDTESESRV
jgi:hypothetical protein